MLAGCNDSTSNSTDYTVVQNAYFLNSGTPLGSDGTVSAYDEDNGTLTLDQYSSSNSSALGANIEDGVISYTQGAMYIVTSNPAKIISAAAINVNNVTPKISLLQNLASVTDGLKNPQCATLNASSTSSSVFLYVTNLGEPVTDSNNNVTYPNSYFAVYNVSSLTPSLLKTYSVGTGAHGIAYANSKIFVATEEGIAVYTDDGNGACTKEGVYKNSKYSGRVYSLATSDVYKICAACQNKGVYTFSTESNTELMNFDFTTGTDPCISADKSNFYYSNNSSSEGEACVGSFDGTTTTIYKGKHISGIDPNPDTKYTFVCDAGAYSAGATVTVLDSSFAAVKTMTAGVGSKKTLFISYYDYK